MKLCSKEGCDRVIIARNLCAKHYQHAKYHDELPPTGRAGRTIVPITHPLYKVWRSMKNRCDNPNNQSYERYGGAGVTYDPEWADFNNFYLDMHEGYQEGLLLDRKHNHAPYCKRNCRWVTYTESNRNRSSVKISEESAEEIRVRYAAGGITQTLLADEYDIDQTTVSDIIRRKSWR